MAISADVDRALASASEQELIEILEGRSERFLATEAIDEIRRRPSSPLTGRLIGLLTARSGEPSARWAAAIALADQPGAERRDALLAALEDPEPEVVRRAAEGLGRIGDEQALERLERVTAYGFPPTQRAVEFARTLLSYRLSRGSHRLIRPPESELLRTDETVPIKAAPADAEAVRKAIANLRRQTAGVAVSEDTALAAACRGDQLLVLLTEEVAQTRDLPSLRRDLVVGLVMNRYSATGYSVYEYLLAHSSDGALSVFCVRPTGVLVHFGKARIAPERAEFEIRAVNTVHSPPIQIAGFYAAAERRLELTTAEVNIRFAADQKRPIVLERPARRGRARGDHAAPHPGL